MEHTNAASLADQSSFWFLGADNRRLRLNGRLTRTFLRGDEISAQFASGNKYLIVTHYDYFDYTDHWFHVVDRDGNVLDVFSTPAYFGFVENVLVEGSDRVSLGFFGTNDRWIFTIHDVGYWSFHASDLIRRANRFLVGKRYISAQRVRGAKWHLPRADAPLE